MKTVIFTLLALVALPSAAQAGAPEDRFSDDPGFAARLAPLLLPDLPFLDSVAAEAPVLGEGLDARVLAAARGREGGAANATLGGIVSGNSAVNVSTGANYITEGSFANMNGLPVVIQNSGANVLIQNATVINLQLR